MIHVQVCEINILCVVCELRCAFAMYRVGVFSCTCTRCRMYMLTHVRICIMYIFISQFLARSSSNAATSSTNDTDDIIEKLKSDLAQRQQTITSLQSQITSLAMTTSTSSSHDTNNLESERSLVQTLQQQLREHLQSLSEAHTTITTHESTIEQQKLKISTADQQITHLLSDVTRMEAIEVNLKEENAELLKQIDELNTRIKSLAQQKTGNEEMDTWKVTKRSCNHVTQRIDECCSLIKVCDDADC